jgi:hypothetical protein
MFVAELQEKPVLACAAALNRYCTACRCNRPNAIGVPDQDSVGKPLLGHWGFLSKSSCNR